MSTSTTDLGPDDSSGVPAGAHAVVAEEIDREINVKGILWCGFWLVVVTLVSQLLMWWFLRGFQVWDQHHEVHMMPMAVANPQQPPPTPRLQIDPTADMVEMRANEDKALTRAGWVDHEGGTLRVPIDVAIDAIAQRGVGAVPRHRRRLDGDSGSRARRSRQGDHADRRPGRGGAPGGRGVSAGCRETAGALTGPADY